MAAKKPLVMTAGQVEQLQSGDTLDASTTEVDVVAKININAGTMPPGTPVYPSSATQVDMARANSQGTSQLLGLTRAAILTNASGSIQTDGILTLTTGEWDDITGQTGGLTFNTPYYVSSVTAGLLTTTAPTSAGTFVVRAGLALSTTELDISAFPPIKL